MDDDEMQCILANLIYEVSVEVLHKNIDILQQYNVVFSN